jgi:integrase
MAITNANPASRERAESTWQARYGPRHGYVRLVDDPALPNGRRGRVTIYRRGRNPAPAQPQTFILAWCAGGRRHKERVTGDKFDAVRRADEITATLRSGPQREHAPLGVDDLISRYMKHLEQRADAGEVSPNTPGRYRSALQHLAAFVAQDKDRPAGRAPVPDRDFALRFKAQLQGTMISPNGHAHTPRRPLAGKGIGFIMASTRAMVHWAVQEGLLPAVAAEGFAQAARCHITGHALPAPPITTDEVIRLIEAADPYQLALFSFHIFHGVRVAEPCWLMAEFLDAAGEWIDYRCIDELGYRTKGDVNKRLPVPAPMLGALARSLNRRIGGPLLMKRRIVESRSAARRPTGDLGSIVRTVRERAPSGWAERARVAADHLKALGAIDGDDVRREFARLIRQAGVRSDLTPKALRHHFATALERADVPYYTRKYLLGHNHGDTGRRGADVTAIYTHLEPDFIRTIYQRVLDGPLAKVVEAFAQRVGATGERPNPAERASVCEALPGDPSVEEADQPRAAYGESDHEQPEPRVRRQAAPPAPGQVDLLQPVPNNGDNCAPVQSQVQPGRDGVIRQAHAPGITGPGLPSGFRLPMCAPTLSLS